MAPKGTGMTFVPPVPIVAALMKPYVETHPIGRLWLAVAVAAGAIELVGAGRRRAEATKKDGGSLIVLRVCLIPAIALLVLSPRIASAAEIRPPLVSAVVGIALFSAGEALRVWSKVALGRYFTYTVMTSSDQPVITSGPYRSLRHPSYTGILLIAIGAGAVWGNWLGLGALTLMTLIGLTYRIHVEEKALLDELGDRYRSYAEHHKRLIPFVW
ncbi:MAG TPA: isoprenylcysteine carboxylmethyltransferase family protein [Acidimicrobiales bacterium]|nr:isoprenylcysteine carboxylmethyltransferase family protein [Acidimicrobiales bacterium]